MGHGGAWTDTGPAFERGRACIPALSPGSRVALSLTSPCLPFLLYRGMMMTAPASWVSCEGSINRRPKCTWHAEALGRSQLKRRPRFLKFTAAKRHPGFSACPSSDALRRSSLFAPNVSTLWPAKHKQSPATPRLISVQVRLPVALHSTRESRPTASQRCRLRRGTNHTSTDRLALLLAAGPSFFYLSSVFLFLIGTKLHPQQKPRL